ncbi:hypothetical protein GPL17_35985 [Bradyrhizobium yuanmingense]|uniref:DUF6876 family protein n=1 Tax=Bradyrhizobium yuanmingense TaxID=108015 RepID=UPI0012FB4126|nr:DUF6876 family protein [Bradyrhizobium yuanmingense]MDF0522186.1 hypothetical protein [Bradyrhizobium yuanmingense]MVT55800.1 hypothetical protein [Bradyrhizobium yuanmingense]
MNAEIFKEIGHYTGTEHWYRHPLNSQVTYTDGAKYVADTAGAYWLLDEIALAQRFEPKVSGEPFQCWKLAVSGSTAVLTCEDGNGTVVHSKDIAFTDFPEPGITLWCTDRVILLPQEY